MKFSEQILDLMAIKKPCIQVRTSLEKEVFASLLNILYDNGVESIYRLSELDNIEKININSKGNIVREPVTIMDEYDTPQPVRFTPVNLLPWTRQLMNNEEDLDNSAFIFLDYESKFDAPAFRRWIKDVYELKNNKYIPFIFITSDPNIPEDLTHLFSVVYYDTPNQEEIVELLEAYEEIKEKELSNKEELAHKFLGFNRTEIIECLDYSFYKFDELDWTYVNNKRIEVIKKSGVLDYREPKLTMNDLAGNDEFKRWYEESKLAFDPEARKYNVPLPKGFLGLSIPGCGKTSFAEAIANDLNVPMLVLNMGSLLSKYVGESERNIDKAIELINQVAPCVLLIDEVEKALGGYKSSNASDSGTLARVFGKILNLLAENDRGIYTVMTSNNVEDLPPELTRAGRLDGIIYFNLGDAEERKAIFNVHLNKRGHNLPDNVLMQIAKETNKYTGAEIEQVVISAIRKAFVRMKKSGSNKYEITIEDLMSAKNDVIPVAVSSRETIDKLEKWVKGRAIYANKVAPKKKPAIGKKTAGQLEEINVDDLL